MTDAKPLYELSRRRWVAPCVLGALVALLMFVLDGKFGSLLGDEGYLWYGTQRVLAGEIPVRDFMGYEIGRYYLSAAALTAVQNHGILALRASLALWMALGLSLSLTLIARAWDEKRWPWLVPPALLIGIWMVPRHKIFDIVISIVLVTAVAQVIAKPRILRFLCLGIAAGLAALMGQNHGAYALAIGGLTFLLLFITERGNVDWIRHPAAWAAGIVAGYLPVICFVLFVPGYLQASLDALKFILIEYKGTNLPLPVPWPWQAGVGSFQVEPFVTGLFFVGLLMLVGLGALVLVRLVRQGTVRRYPVFVAALLVAIPYTNVAFSRADVNHLAQAIAPALIAALTLPGIASSTGWRKRLLWPALLMLLCFTAAAQLHPRFQSFRSSNWRSVRIGADRLRVDPDTANFLDTIRNVRQKYGLEGGVVLSVPLTPGLSAALGERNPSWEIYPLFPRSHGFQRNEISRLMATPPALVI